MRYFIYAYKNITCQLSLNIIRCVLISAIIIAVNVVIGSYNSRNILLAPYEDMFSQNGCFCYYYFNDFYADGTEADGSQEDADNLMFDEIEQELEGNFRTLAVYTSSSENASIIILPDEIYDGLEMPLSQGNKNIAISTQNSFYQQGDSVKICDMEVTISGVLTASAYVPTFSAWTENMDVSTLYESFISDASRKATVIVPISLVKSEIEKYNGNGIYDSCGKIIIYDKSTSDEAVKQNRLVLQKYGNVESFEDLSTRSETYVNENINKLLPIVICVVIVAIMGILCCSVLSIYTNARNFGIYYVSGCSRLGVIILNSVENLVMSVVGISITCALFYVIKLKNIDKIAGIVISGNNYYFTAICIGALYAFSIMVSVYVFRTNRIIETLNIDDI